MDITVVNVNTNDDRKWSFEMPTGTQSAVNKNNEIFGISVQIALPVVIKCMASMQYALQKI